MYIYIIRNLVNDKVLVGQTQEKRPNNRWTKHKWFLKKNSHVNNYLQHAWNKYGEAAFEFELIDAYSLVEELNEMEDFYIEEIFHSRNPKLGYNLRRGGKNGNMSDVSKKKIRQYWTKERRDVRRKQSAQRWKDPHMRKMLVERNKENGMKLAKKYDGFVSPTGKIYSPVVNLSKFCRNHNLILGHMQSVDRGNRITHRGWKRVNGRLSKTRKLTKQERREILKLVQDGKSQREIAKLYHIDETTISHGKGWRWKS